MFVVVPDWRIRLASLCMLLGRFSEGFKFMCIMLHLLAFHTSLELDRQGNCFTTLFGDLKVEIGVVSLKKLHSVT